MSPSEGGRKPQGENHQALVGKGERHPTESELNPDHSGERRTRYHGATKPLFKVKHPLKKIRRVLKFNIRHYLEGLTSVTDTGSVGACVCVVLGPVRVDTVPAAISVVTSITVTRTVLVVLVNVENKIS